MNVDLGIWGKLTRVVVFLLLLAGVLGVAVWYLPLVRQNERMRKEVLRKDGQIAQEEETSRQLKTSIESLRSSHVDRQTAAHTSSLSRVAPISAVPHWAESFE